MDDHQIRTMVVQLNKRLEELTATVNQLRGQEGRLKNLHQILSNLPSAREVQQWQDSLKDFILRELMATRQEVREVIAALSDEVKAERGEVNSAIALQKKTLEMITDAAKEADDLEQFKRDLELIKTEVTSQKTDIEASIRANSPTTQETPTPQGSANPGFDPSAK